MLKKKSNSSEREFQNFINYASKLEAMEFMGLVRMLNVDIFKNDKGVNFLMNKTKYRTYNNL